MIRNFPVMPGVPAAGHVTSNGFWHPGSAAGCQRTPCNSPPPIERVRSRYSARPAYTWPECTCVIGETCAEARCAHCATLAPDAACPGDIDGPVARFIQEDDADDEFDPYAELGRLKATMPAAEFAVLCTRYDVCPVHVTDIAICRDDQLACQEQEAGQ